MTEELIVAKKLRIREERIYFLLLLIVSFIAWGALIFSTAFQIIDAFSVNDPRTKCYLRDTRGGKAYEIDEEVVYKREQCITWDQLSSGEQVDLRIENNTLKKLFGNIFTPLFLSLLVLFTLFSHFLAMAHIRLNSVRVGPKQFPELYEALTTMSKRLQIKNQPSLFLICGNGVLNAFATMLIFRKLIVFYSDLAEILMEEKNQAQLEAVLAHELGHHALGHTGLINWVLLPGMILPFLPHAFSRAREYSADQVMYATNNDKEVCSRALIKLAAGKQYGRRTNIEELTRQGYEETGFFSWISEILATHPHIIKRIDIIQDK